MGMRLRNADPTSKSSLRELAITNLVPDVSQQPEARVPEGQVGLSSYFSLK
jgi:hypothetical protein